MAKYPITISVFSTGCRAASGDAELRRSTNLIPTANKKARLKKKAILEKRRNWNYDLRITIYEMSCITY